MANEILDDIGTIVAVIGFGVLVWGSYKFGSDIVNRRLGGSTGENNVVVGAVKTLSPLEKALACTLKAAESAKKTPMPRYFSGWQRQYVIQKKFLQFQRACAVAAGLPISKTILPENAKPLFDPAIFKKNDAKCKELCRYNPRAGICKYCLTPIPT